MSRVKWDTSPYLCSRPFESHSVIIKHPEHIKTFQRPIGIKGLYLPLYKVIAATL